MWTVRKVRFGTVRETLQAGVASGKWPVRNAAWRQRKRLERWRCGAGRSGEVEGEADE
jgi:hypothetical protein